MLTLANGTYFPAFLIYFAFGLVIRLLPVTFVTFHRQNPALSFPVLNFNLPFELDEAHFPRVKRLGSLLFWGFGLLDLACMLCYDRWLYQVLPVSYSRISGGIFCLCICTVLIGMYLASQSRDDP